MLYICISIISTRYMQWCSPIGILKLLPRPVWPICKTGQTGSPRLSSKLGIWQFWMSTYAFMFLGKACVPRNISHSPKLHWNNEKHLRTNPALLSRVILYIGHAIRFFHSRFDDDQISLEPLLFVFTRSFNASWIMQIFNNKLSNY